MSERDVKRIELLSEVLAGSQVQHEASYGDIRWVRPRPNA